MLAAAGRVIAPTGGVAADLARDVEDLDTWPVRIAGELRSGLTIGSAAAGPG